ncbi:MAG: TlpA disulfide reductase family protein [Pseudomonadota bacterium]
MNKNLFVGLMVSIFCLSFSPVNAERLLDPMPRTMKAQNFTLPSINNEDVSLSDFKGKFLLVNFWSTKCTICRAELTTMQDLYNQMEKDGRLEIIAIHAGDDAQGVVEQVEINPVTFPMLVDADLEMGHWGVPTLPTTYLVTPDGSFAYRALGIKVWNSPNMVDFLNQVFDEYDQSQQAASN